MVATGVKECAELWDMKVRGELPDENADDEEEEEKEKEYDDSEDNTDDFFEDQKINGNARSLFLRSIYMYVYVYVYIYTYIIVKTHNRHYSYNKTKIFSENKAIMISR